MKLFLIEVKFKRRRRDRYGAEVLVHERSRAAAERYVTNRYIGCEILHTSTLENVPKHFILSDLVD